MKKLYLLFIFSSVAGLFNACVKEQQGFSIPQGDLIPLNISSNINQVPTKANAEGFVDKDALGLYAVNWINNNTEAGTFLSEGNQADNVKYVFDETNQKWTPVKAVYYKDANTHADLYLYYPFQSSITDVNASNFEVSKDQSKAATSTELSGYEISDFLWGKAENVTPSESKVAVVLNHKLSSVIVTLKEKEESSGFEPGEFEQLPKSVILTNTTRKANIDFSTGKVTGLGGPQIDGIVMCPQGDDSFRAIAIPQDVTSGQLFSITINGQTYKYESEERAFEPGQAYNFTISFSKKVPSGEYELELSDFSIVDWTEDKNTHGGEARQYFVVNVTEPGTLGATIKAMGKNPDKIKNLKVTGTITDEDFYFMRDNMTGLVAVNLKESNIKNASISGVKYNKEGKWDYWDRRRADKAIPDNAFSEKKTLFYIELPEALVYIGSSAFYRTNLTSAIIFPDSVEEIGSCSFEETKITAAILPKNLKRIGSAAFYSCRNIDAELNLPNSVEHIGSNAFERSSFSGRLNLPENLAYLGQYAFQYCEKLTGDLIIPESIKILYPQTFNSCKGLNGHLIIPDQIIISNDDWAGDVVVNGGGDGMGLFSNCNFVGEVKLPSTLLEIPSWFLYNTRITSISNFDNILKIGAGALGETNLSGYITLPEGLSVIENRAFQNCSSLTGLDLPSSVTVIESNAFNSCYYLSRLTCRATEPPATNSETFNTLPKDNFVLEVPSTSINKYRSSSNWSDFKRIAAHYDFSVSRERMRALNAEQARTYTLRAPANFKWSIQNKPEWVSVSPESGTGKTDIIITVEKMDRTSETFEVNEGTYNNPSYKTYKGRSGEIIFQLDEEGVDYTCSFEVEQYDSEYSDGEKTLYQPHSTGNGIDIVFVGDGYDAKDIANGTFNSNVQDGIDAFFGIEPYKTYKDYFNVYAVISQSDDSGIGTVNTVVDTKFGTYFTQNRIKVPAPEPIFSWAKKADDGINFTEALVINLLNTSTYEGICAMYADGSAIAFCPVSRDAYPYDFRGIIQHEAGGHGFGKLGDEYIYHNAFIQNCDCTDGCDHPVGDNDTQSNYGKFKSLGWYKNLSMNGDMHQVPWAHLIYNPKYSNYVDMYEGGYMHSRGVYRSEATSCMNNNIPYYSAISRQAMVERILEISGEGFTLEKFYANDSNDFGAHTKASNIILFDRTFGVDPLWNRGSEEGSVVYMGEHPDYSKIK